MLTEVQMISRLVLALLLGAIIGFERELHEKAAGLRTHTLVCIGACLITISSIHVSLMYKGVMSTDPARIAAQIVSGIGFLGAGTIIRSRTSVIGLTTAASLWAVAGIGLAIGTGLYLVSIWTAFLILTSLWLMSRFVDRIHRKNR